ncbi:MAG: hypothetical protein KBF88_05070 [Polyangiaceae bacterium]|nr:hypothetical protein [Polyangiaceae bacterium]
MKTLLCLASLAFALAACSAESETPELGDEVGSSEGALSYVPGQYEVDALLKDLQAGKFNGKTFNQFVDPNVGVYSVNRPGGVFDQVTFSKAPSNDEFTWGMAKRQLETFAITKDYRRVIPGRYSCETDNGTFPVTVEDPKTGKPVKIATGLKMFIHRWQPGGVALLNPVSSTIEDHGKYGLENPNTASFKKKLADAKAFEKNISVKVVVPALILNKKDAAGKPIPSNPGGAKDLSLDLYFGRINGVWKLLVVDTAAYDCSA